MINRLIHWSMMVILVAGFSILFADSNDDLSSPMSGPRSLLFLAKGLSKKTTKTPEKTAEVDNKQALQLTPVPSDSIAANTITAPPPAPTPNTMQPAYSESEVFTLPSGEEENAFQNVSRSAMPMTPEQIRRFKSMMDYTQRAAELPVNPPPKPELSVQAVSLSPGASPPVVRLQQGFVTSVLFIDDSGMSWPIESYDLGNSKAFNIQWISGSNMLMIEALSAYTYGNLAVKLKELATPVILTLIPGQQVVDYRVDLQIQQTRPGENPNAGQGDGSAAGEGNGLSNQILLSILNGIPPAKAQVLKVEGEDCKAWLIGNKMYLRTKLAVLSPGWLSMLHNPDGTRAYEMMKSPMILVSKYGKLIKLKIEGFV